MTELLSQAKSGWSRDPLFGSLDAMLLLLGAILTIYTAVGLTTGGRQFFQRSGARILTNSYFGVAGVYLLLAAFHSFVIMGAHR